MVMSLDVGVTPNPSEYGLWFPKMGPKVGFARVFCPPGSGLGHTRTALPPGVLPWISHKDLVPIPQVREQWQSMIPPADGRRFRWTFHHESAPNGETGRREYLDYWHLLIEAAADFPHIELVQIQSNYAMRWRTDTDWHDWIIPGVSIGFDCYPLAGFRYEPPASMFGLLAFAAVLFRCPSWGVPELGCAPRGGQDRGEWLGDCADFLEMAGASFLGLWCSQEVRDGQYFDYRPTDPNTLATYRRLTS